MNPFIEKTISVAPGVINTLLSVIKDKSNKSSSLSSKSETSPTEFVNENIDKGVNISVKRVLNIGGFGIILTYALTDITTNGITKYNLILMELHRE